jgi:hypothetical protein
MHTKHPCIHTNTHKFTSSQANNNNPSVCLSPMFSHKFGYQLAQALVLVISIECVIFMNYYYTCIYYKNTTSSQFTGNCRLSSMFRYLLTINSSQFAKALVLIAKTSILYYY